MTLYLPRSIDRDLDELLPAIPAIFLDGPKGVGKTETATRRAESILRLDDPGRRQVVEADLDLALSGPRPVLVDEWQRLPPIWDAIKRAVDRDPSPGQFILTGGSATAAEPTHSGAGRITTLRMRPMALHERGHTTSNISLAQLLSSHFDTPIGGDSALDLAGYTDAILRSGFPALRELTGRPLRLQLDSYLDRIIERDVPEAGLMVRKPATMRAWLAAYAAATSTTATWERIRTAATPGHADPPAKTTVIPYIDTLTTLRILDELDAWHPGHNHLNRLGTTAKHHIVDPALAARAVGVDRHSLLTGQPTHVTTPTDGTYLGALFESLATLSTRVAAQPADAHVAHLRTRNGDHEIDLIVEGPDRRIVALETKLAATITDRDVRHLHWLRSRVGDQLADAAVLTTGPQAYRRPDGIAVIPLALLGP